MDTNVVVTKKKESPAGILRLDLTKTRKISADLAKAFPSQVGHFPQLFHYLSVFFCVNKNNISCFLRLSLKAFDTLC